MFSLNMVDYPMSFLLLSSLGLGRKGLGPGLDNIVGGFLQTGVDWFFAWWSSHKALSFPENFSLSQDYIPCVIVFTTEMCLSLLSNVKKGNPDGTFTFDLASKHFTQFFILSDDYKKSSTLCAMDWLPDIFFKYSLLLLYIEKALSYHLFFLLLLIEFKERFLKSRDSRPGEPRLCARQGELEWRRNYILFWKDLKLWCMHGHSQSISISLT